MIKKLHPICDFSKIFLILLCCYSIVNFLLLPHNHIISFPVNFDDYNELTYTFSSITWHTPRPVFYFLAPLFAQLGITGYYILLLGSVVLLATLVFCFARSFFSIAVPMKWLIFYGIALFSYPFILDVSKNFGLMVNFCASLSALISMILLLKGHRENKALFFILAAIFYTFSLFSKEDFILPEIVLIFYLWVFKKQDVSHDSSKIKIFVFGLYVVMIISALFLFNKYLVQSDFTGMGKASPYPYQINIHFLSILEVFKEYFFNNLYQVLIFVSILFTVGVSLFLLKPTEKIKIGFFSLLIVSLLVPYSILPHHVIYFYTYNWMPFEIVLLCYCLFLLSKKTKERYSMLFLIFFSIALVLMSYPHRNSYSIKLERSSKINKNIMSTLSHYKDELNHQAYIGVTGIQDLAHRLDVSVYYVIYMLGIKTKWIFYLNEEEIKTAQFNQSTLHGNILIMDIDKICKIPGMKYLYFTPDGKGKLTDTCERALI